MGKLISVTEAAKRMGITSQGIRMAYRAGKLTGEKSGGILLIDEDSLKDYHPVRRSPRQTPKRLS